MSLSAVAPPRDQILRGIGLMVLAMALLALSDMFIKLTAAYMAPGQIMVLLSLGGTLVFLALARLQRARVIDPLFWHPMVMLRNVLEMVAGIGLVFALAWVPLSIFAAIMQMAPLIVTVGAWAFLGEPVGPRRWLAVAAGLLGMLLVVRPGMEGFTPAALFAVLAITALAFRDLVTRLSPQGLASITLSAWGFATTIPTGVVVMAVMGTPFQAATTFTWPIVGAVLVTALGYYAITTAMRVAPVSIVAPFRYTRLVFTMGLGVLVFGERPDPLTLLGAAIILGAGLYTFMRERRLARAGSGPA